MIQKWNIGLLYAFPPFSMISRVLLKIKNGMCSSSDSNCISFEYPAMVPRTLKHLCQETSAAVPGTRNSGKPKKYCPPIDGAEVIDASGLVGFREILLCERISENASHIFTNSRQKGTLSNFESACRNGLAGALNEKFILFRHL